MIRLNKAKANEYTIQKLFNYGYRNKEDVSNLPPNTLVIGSQNVLTNAAELVGIRQGYSLDGAAGNQNSYGIDSAYDFLTSQSSLRNLRKWGTNLEVRYVNPVTSTVSWLNILATLNASKVVNFTSFWDQDTELKNLCLFVNGDTNLHYWSGGLASFASSTPSVAGIITAIAINNGGTAYKPGDVLTVTTGGDNATANVLATNTSGVITAIQLVNAGSGYSTGTGVATTTNSVTGGTGATVNITSVGTGGTITVSGSLTIPQLNFFDNTADSGHFQLTIGGVQYTYTSVHGNTFYGVTPDPSLAAIAVGDPIFQTPYEIPVNQGGLTGLPTNLILDLISTLDNQIWLGSLSNNSVYVSKINSTVDYSFSSPARLPAEGALITLDQAPVGFMPQAENMYISAGRDEWWLSEKNQQTVTVDNIATPTETLYAARLKTAFNQAAQSQSLIGQFKNSLVYVSNEQIINALGLVKDIYSDPQVTNMSDPIKYDVDAYNFKGGQIIYDNYFIYVSVPAEGVVRMYNVVKQYWEAPQTIPVSFFYHVNSVLYGHSSLTNESYELFTGYNDNNNPINAVAAFPYVSAVGGSPFQKKSFNKIYTEGYIASNTNILLNINYDFGGFSGTYTTEIEGSDQSIIFNKITDGSLGRNSLGTQPVGTILNLPNQIPIPKFRVIDTMPRQDVYEYQIVYSSNDVDQQWTLLRFGPASSASDNEPFEITK